MGGQNPPYYTPLSKPTLLRRPRLCSLAALAVLCSLSYLLGAWNHGGGGGGAASNLLGSAISCLPPNATTAAPRLDFSSHHSASITPAAAREYPPCDARYVEYTPCEDQRRSLKFNRDRLIYRERHCPKKGEVLKCRIPAPYGYRTPFRWPESQDLAWYANVPHKELTVEKAVQNWIRFEGDRFRFPGGGTMFPNGADAYIDDIGRLINLKDGSIRTAIDTGCGVASWGAYLMSRNILTMSFAPRDTHEAQVQFALERGVPALIGVIASKRLPYPSRAFDMAHCSRCLIPWGQYDGAYLIEVDRVLRPGGYWILSGPPINWRKYWKGWERSKEDLNAEQMQIENVTRSLCWKKLVEKNDIAIWQKPYNHLKCKKLKTVHKKPALCPARDPDKAWYTNLETCLTPLPEVSASEDVSGGKIEKWPKRLNAIPPRVSRGTVNGVNSLTFRHDTQLWKKRVSYYKSVNNQLGQTGRYRNILDMNSFLGGFAANLIEDPVWVMNVVPVEAKVNTLGVIYERGLIGTYQNWCEAMSTYPRTYDLIHADSVFTLYKDRCEMEDILLEMDRILRPEGSLIVRDDVDMLVKVKKIADAMNWESRILDHEDGPLEREKLLFAVKLYWTAPANSGQQS
ncbi:S-adenosyl-L-methionine-dependentmethyltransferases superfamily protein [Striga asiatica]|uniref:Methyltransferase n=1 Tax=Striga asiatica TaxID=4170 RepID=A0A5A7PRR7_STRAF|nr:S-adenosyl-L-methionine-dependentmethyltransferases superfamily protein [Striga asiatica]